MSHEQQRGAKERGAGGVLGASRGREGPFAGSKALGKASPDTEMLTTAVRGTLQSRAETGV